MCSKVCFFSLYSEIAYCESIGQRAEASLSVVFSSTLDSRIIRFRLASRTGLSKVVAELRFWSTSTTNVIHSVHLVGIVNVVVGA
jgi:hypothetical protein